jgi:hypothetical protein
MIVAKLAGVQITEETITQEQIKEKKIAERSLNATLPALETEDGNILT